MLAIVKNSQQFAYVLPGFEFISGEYITQLHNNIIMIY